MGVLQMPGDKEASQYIQGQQQSMGKSQAAPGAPEDMCWICGLLCRRLVMMRHAESEERLQGIRDHDRPITDEGRSSAREVSPRSRT